MKITQLETGIVRVPLDEPLADGPTAKGATQSFVTLRLRTDEGVEGVGITFFGGGAMSGALKAAIEDLMRDKAVACGEIWSAVDASTIPVSEEERLRSERMKLAHS